MGVKDLQKFNVRGDDRNQIAAVPAFEFCGAEAAKIGKYLMPDDRQQPERYEMVAVLLTVVKDSAEDRCKEQDRKKGPCRKRHPYLSERRALCCGACDDDAFPGQRLTQHLEQFACSQDRQGNRAQKTCDAQGNGHDHERKQRFYETDQLSHNDNARSSFA